MWLHSMLSNANLADWRVRSNDRNEKETGPS